jgi:hypothetical protein
MQFVTTIDGPGKVTDPDLQELGKSDIIAGPVHKNPKSE